MNDPFVVLGITKSEATALKGLTSSQRVKGLDMLRRYFAWILHPDITEKDGVLLAKVNSAIDVLKTGNSFNKYYDEYIKSVPVSVGDDYIITLNRERRYWKNTLDEQALGFQKELHQKENEIRILTEENTDLRAGLKSKEYKNAELRRRIRNIQNRERNRSGK